MKKNIHFFLLATFVFTYTSTIAQNNTLSSGGNTVGVTGSTSFSIGQVFYISQIGSDGSVVSQGLQQSYEIKTLSNEDLTFIQLYAKVYPNPTTQFVVLKIMDNYFNQLQYELYDLTGKLLLNKKVIEEETIIDMNSLPTSVYLLKVNQKNKELKSFRIIKNSN